VVVVVVLAAIYKQAAVALAESTANRPATIYKQAAGTVESVTAPPTNI
jgi:hypothetical protein